MTHPDALSTLQAQVGKEFTYSPSPFTYWLKPFMLSAESGRLRVKYTVRHDMTNPLRGLHGGVTAAIMDDVIGATIYSLNEDYFYTTVNNVVDYFSPASEGDEVIASTEVIRKGKQVINVQCEIRDSSGSRLIARGYSNLLKTTIHKEHITQEGVKK